MQKPEVETARLYLVSAANRPVKCVSAAKTNNFRIRSTTSEWNHFLSNPTSVRGVLHWLQRPNGAGSVSAVLTTTGARVCCFSALPSARPGRL